MDSGMPADFPRRIHQELRHWHEQHALGVLDDLLLARQIRSMREVPTSRLVINEILISGLDVLRTVDASAYELLQRRFPSKETVRAIAHRTNMTEDVIYRHQHAAIRQLAKIIWDQEQGLRSSRVQYLEARLEPPSYTQLFGVADRLAEVETLLESPAEPWIVSVEGMGGIGKTAFVDMVARRLACSTHFEDIAWISARRRHFRLPNGVVTLRDTVDLTATHLASYVAFQFGLADLCNLPDAERYAGVKEYLRTRPFLLIIDSLETAVDYWALLSSLRQFAAPSKFLITTRYSLQGESGVYILKLDALSLADTLALVRQEAAVQGLRSLSLASDHELAPIYDVTCGNPLATKLVIAQTHTIPLSVVLRRIGSVDDHTADEFLSFICADAWQRLSPDNLAVISAVSTLGDTGGCLEQIAHIAKCDVDLTAASLLHLAIMSLVDVKGDLTDKRYRLHPLTGSFVARQMMNR